MWYGQPILNNLKMSLIPDRVVNSIHIAEQQMSSKYPTVDINLLVHCKCISNFQILTLSHMF